MKKCPYCTAQNHDEATLCYNCGRDFAYQPTYQTPPPPPPATDPTPTQPLHVRPRPLQQPYQAPPSFPAPPSFSAPPPSNQPPPDATQPYPLRQSYPQQPYQDPQYQQPVYQQPPYQQPAYQPPPPSAYPSTPAPAPRRHFWPVLVLGLGLLMLFACGLAVWSLVSATSMGTRQLGAQVSTQVAGVFGNPNPNPGPNSTDPAVLDAPTPWPTFTPQSTEAPQPTETALPTQPAAETPNPTQEVYVEKLLSPDCKNALDNLGQVSDLAKTQPLKVLDAAWRSEFNQSMAAMKTNCGTLDSASPVPGKVAGVRNDLNQASSEFDQANKLWTEAIDNREPAKIFEAAQHMGKATELLAQAVAGLKNVAP